MSLESRDLLDLLVSVDPLDLLDPQDCPVLLERLVVRYATSICCILTLNQRHPESLDSRVSHSHMQMHL